MIKITEDKGCEMIKIEFNGKCIFYGNYTDFSRDSKGFKELFEDMDIPCEVEQVEYDSWD
jgi:hypothetical protein